MAFCKVLFCTDFVLDMCVCVWWYKTDFLLWVTAKKSEEYSASEVTADRVWVTRLRVSGSASGPDASFMKVNLPSRPTFVFQGLCPDLPRSQEEVVRAPPYERQRSGGGPEMSLVVGAWGPACGWEHFTAPPLMSGQHPPPPLGPHRVVWLQSRGWS